MLGETRTLDLKQHLDWVDYLGPLIVWICFFGFVFLFTLTILNWCCVGEADDITVVEEWGFNHQLQVRLGPHRPSVIARNVRKQHKVVDH